MALVNILLSSQLTLSKAERTSLYDKAQFSYKTLGKLHIWRYLERAHLNILLTYFIIAPEASLSPVPDVCFYTKYK